jgi:nucleolar protein 14
LKRDSVPGNFPILDFEMRETLGINTKSAPKLSPNPAPLSEIINWDQAQPAPEQHKVDLLAVVYDLLGQFAALYKGLEGFIELFEPVIPIGESLKIGSLSESVQVRTTPLVLGRSAAIHLVNYVMF